MENNREIKLNFNTVLMSYLSIGNYNIDELFVLYCIDNEFIEILKVYLDKKNSDQKLALFQRFERKLLLKRLSDLEEFDLDNYVITEQGEVFLNDCSYHFTDLQEIISQSEEGTAEFIDSFLLLWPEGTRNRSGDYLRSNKQDLKSKLKSFFKKYKYDEETVLKATKNYLNQQALSRYEFANAAHYFVSKSGISKLANECENVITGNTTENDISSFTDQLM